MKTIKKIFKWLLYFLSIPFAYLIVSLVLGSIPIGRDVGNIKVEKSIYLTTNGVHLNIVVPVDNVNPSLLAGIKHSDADRYLSFGWGDEKFYLQTPTWSDLTLNTALRAVFLKSSTLMHVTRYEQKRSDWIEIKVNTAELEKLNNYVQNAFQTDENGMKIRLQNEGYSPMDDFYKAKGNYTLFKTCNSWVNTGFKKSGLKACLWTPFDFALMNKYE